MSLPPRSYHRKHGISRAFLILGAFGCGGRPEGFEKYVTPPAPARAALTAVLDAWRDGRPAGEGVGPKRDVHVVDHQRKPGQSLARYEVLGEVAADNARGFAVRLTLENPDEQPSVRFLVVGLEPLWVFRKEDFEMISHWMHPMNESGPEGEPAGTEPRP